MGRAGQRLDLLPGLPQTAGGPGSPWRRRSPRPPGGPGIDGARSEPEDGPSPLESPCTWVRASEKAEGQGEPDLVGNSLRSAGGSTLLRSRAGKAASKGILQNLVGFPKGRPENQGIPVGIQPGPGQTPSPHGDSNRGAFVEIQVPADIPEPDAEENGPGEGTVPGPQEDPQSQIEAVGRQSPPGLFPLRRGIGRRPKKLVDVLEGGFIHPIQNHQLGAQVQLLHLGAPQVQDLGGRSKPTIQNQSQADILDPALRKIRLVDAPVLDHGPGQGHLAHAGHIGHGLGPRRRLGRSKIWGQLRHVEPPSVGSPRLRKAGI